MLHKLKLFEADKIKLSPLPHIGVDEVGRGCLAGPVCAGVVILNEKNPYTHFKDSKSLSEEKRKLLAEEIRLSHYWALGWASALEVDQVNIRQATFLAMQRALQELQNKYPQFDLEKGTLMVDGRDFVPNLNFKNQIALVKGDFHLRCISAASIVAKVARDELMNDLAVRFPQYGFEKHKGYGTAVHRAALEKFNETPEHRKTFGGVKEHLA